MSDNGKTLPFPTAVPNVPLVGQPFSIEQAFVRVDLQLTCNCGGGQTVSILASTPASCSACGKSYNARFNPVVGKLEIAIGIPKATS